MSHHKIEDNFVKSSFSPYNQNAMQLKPPDLRNLARPG